MNLSDWISRHLRRMPVSERAQITQELKNSSSPGFDFFLLVILSTSISTLGLITNSPAVIIGAMLVAPLMSPIVGMGLASIIGDGHLFRNAASALFRGALMAVLLAALMAFVNNHLPFISLQDLPSEILTRTHPSPIDLVIALAGGIAAAYAITQPQLSAALPGVAIATALMPPLSVIGIGIALGRWDVAGGASLLFITNAITIAFASALVFFLLGFSPRTLNGDHRLPGSLQFSALLTFVLLIPLTFYSLQFFRQAAENRLINDVVAQEVHSLGSAELAELNVTHSGDTIDLDITIRTSQPLRYEQVVALQAQIVKALKLPVSLNINQVLIERLNPLIPPTATPTPTPTKTPTPGPSPTYTPLPTNTPTSTATATATYTPTPTATFTPTPAQARVLNITLPRLSMYQEPGGPVIATLRANQVLTVLYGSQVYKGLVWLQVKDSEGRIGWVPEIYLQELLPYEVASPTPSLTISP